MLQRNWTLAGVAILVLLASGLDGAHARYRYYRSPGSIQSDGQGAFVALEGGLFNPRNSDAVVATIGSSPVLPVWDDEVAGRLTLGYSWADGNQVWISAWGFDADQRGVGSGLSGQRMHYAIGPPLGTENPNPGYYDIVTEIEAATIDLAWGRSAELGDDFTMEWSLGLRYASYEETSDGFYDDRAINDPSFGADRYTAAKSNEAEMFGARLGLRGRYRLGERYSVAAGLGLSFLDGEIEASSGLLPSGSSNGGGSPSAAQVTDDGRSGTIRDFDVVFTWHAAGDRIRLWLGWEQSEWGEIAADLVRDFPGTGAPLRDRDTVTFSGYKAGVFLRF